MSDNPYAQYAPQTTAPSNPYAQYAPTAATSATSPPKPKGLLANFLAGMDNLGGAGRAAGDVAVGVPQAAMLAGRAIGGDFSPPNAMETSLNTAEADREKRIAAERAAAGNTGLDWTRLAGNIANPLNYVGGAESRGVTTLARLADAARAGAFSNAMQPSTGQDDQAKNIALGALISPAAAGVTEAAGKAVSRLMTPVAERVAQKTADTQNRAAETVERRVTQDLQGSSKSAQDVIDELNEGRALGKPLTLADVSGENVLGLAGAVSRQPGPAKNMLKQFFEKRAEQSAGRMESDVTRDVSSGESAKKTVDTLLDARSTEGNPLYKKAFEGGSMAPLEKQFSNHFADADKAVAEAAAKVQQAQNTMTQASAKVSRAGDNVYAVNTANREAAAAKEQMEAAQAELKEAQAGKEQARTVLQQAQADKSANAKGAVWNPRIQRLIDNPELKKGIARGLRIQRNESDANFEKFDPTEYAVTGEDANGDPIVGKVPNMRLLNAAKKGLDAIVRDNTDEVTGRVNELGRSVDMLRKSLLKELDDINPDYKAARQAWSDRSASKDAVDWGRKLFTRQIKPEDARDYVGSLSANDREFAKLGAADALREAIGTKGVTAPEIRELAKGSRNNWIKEKLRPLFDSEDAYNRFIDSVTAERKMFKTESDIFQGSQTAKRLAEDETSRDLEAGLTVAKGAAHMIAGNFMGALSHFLQAKKYLGLRNNPELNSAIAKLISDPSLLVNSQPGMSMLERFPGPRTQNMLAQRIRNAGRPVGPGLAAGVVAATQPRDQ